MPEYGWKPFVLTSADPYALNEDESLMKDIPSGASVCRAGSLIPMRFLRGTRRAFSTEEKSGSGFSMKPAAALMLRKIFRTLFVNMLVPDIMTTWAPFAYRLGKSLCMKENIQVIFATDPPSDYLVGAALSRRFHVPLVVDFRDSWTLRRYGTLARGPVRKSIERRMESGVLRHAKTAVFVNSHMLKKYENAYPGERQKFCVIPNGYDEQDFSRLPEVEKQSGNQETVFTMLHAGRLSEFQNPIFLFKALRSLLDENAVSQDTFQLSFAGDFYFTFRQMIHDLKIEGLVRLRPYLPHSVIVNEMMTADMLLLMCGDDAEITTGKLYEYLAANRPIFALAPPEGEACRILRDAEAGSVVRYNDLEGIKNKLREFLFGRERLRRWSNKQERVTQFSRRRLTQTLCEILMEAAG